MENSMRQSPPTFESVWLAMQETDRRMQETDRRMQETDRRMQETDRLIKENQRFRKKNSHSSPHILSKNKTQPSPFVFVWRQSSMISKM